MTNVYDFLKYHPELYRQFSCKNILIGYYDCPQARKTVDVFTHYNMFIFDIRGKKRFHKAGKSWVFEPGNGLLMKKGAFYQEMYFEEGLRSLTFYVSDSQLRQLIREYYTFNQSKLLSNQATEPIIELELNDASNQFLQAILACFSQQPPPSEETVEKICYELLFSLLKNPANQPVILYLNSIAGHSKTSLYEVMESNYMYNLSLSEYARISNRSLTTFKRDFKRLFNSLPAQWLIGKRLEYAKILLDTTQKSIGEVSFESGFENNAHFSRTFKEKMGISPLQYRREQMASALV